MSVQELSREHITLDKLNAGAEATVTDLDSENNLLFRKLVSMGIIVGSKVQVLRRAPLGDPISIRALGYTLCLRNSEARTIHVSRN